MLLRLFSYAMIGVFVLALVAIVMHSAGVAMS
jgi:hypothetical protein